MSSIMQYNGAAVIAMAGKNCVAIASDRRYGIRNQTISCEMLRPSPCSCVSVFSESAAIFEVFRTSSIVACIHRARLAQSADLGARRQNANREDPRGRPTKPHLV